MTSLYSEITLQEHNENLKLVLQRVKDLGLRSKPTKCEYLKPELEYLGHLITAEGVKPNPAKVDAIKNFKNLKNVKDVQSFLGLAGYYRKFIKSFSTIARPLTRLTQKETIFDWTTDCEKAFYDLRHALTTAPVLRFPNFKEQFTLTTDASNHGLGAVLSQNGHPCLFISRTLNKAEENYTTSEKELLAIVWAMKRLRQYLLGNVFKIQTDHKALVWLHNVKDPSSRLLRWRLRMEEYKYEIEYVKGKENKVADCLSRLFPINLEDASPDIEIPDTLVITQNKILPRDQRMTLKKKDITERYGKYLEWKKNPVGSVKLRPNAPGKLWKEINKADLGKYNEKEWLSFLSEIVNQQKNKGYSIIRITVNDPLVTPLEKESVQEMMKYISSSHPDYNFHLCFSNKRELTKEERKSIMKESHNGHLGEHKTLDKARKLGHWTGIDKDVIEYVKKCPICQLEKTTRIKNQAESILPEIPLEPNDKIALDVYGPLPVTQNGNKFVLSLQDRLTRYTILMPMKETDSGTIIENLIEHYIYIFGAPKTILTDQGSNFISDIMQEFEKALQIKHIKTTAFHPQSNENIERMHSTLTNLIKTACNENSKEWDENLKYINFVINTMKNETTGFSPYELTFGREPNLPSTIPNTPTLTMKDLIRKWKRKHDENIRRARQRIEVEAEKTKKRLDDSIVRKHPIYKTGQHVNVLNNFKRNKLDSSWKGPFEITKIIDNNNIEIRIGEKEIRIHIDNTMPYVLDESPDPAPTSSSSD